MADKFGYITQVIGPVVDVAFEGEGNEVPPIYAALKIERENGAELIVEVEQHIGENTVLYYAKFGFVDEGVSEKSTHGNVVWHQMRLSFDGVGR